MKNCLQNIYFIVFLIVLLLYGCGPRQFAVRPEMMPREFTVKEKFGTLVYKPVVDMRSEIDKKGDRPESCLGSGGVLILGDENYKNPLLPEVDRHMRNSLLESGLFRDVLDESKTNEYYIFKSTIDKFHVILNETKAQQTQACIGGILGAIIASSIDVEATTNIQLTGILMKGDEEVWRKIVSKQVVKIDDYSNTEKNLEKCMGEAIGKATKELITDLARYLASQ